MKNCLQSTLRKWFSNKTWLSKKVSLALALVMLALPGAAHCQEQSSSSGKPDTTGIPARSQQPIQNIGSEKPGGPLQIISSTRILPGSKLYVDVADETELTGEYSVDDKGEILLGISDTRGVKRESWSVAVAKLTANEAQEVITESLKKYIRKPAVHVKLLSIPHTRVILSGAGCRPGSIDLPVGAHFSDILFACGANADFQHVLVRRRIKRGLSPNPGSGAPGKTGQSGTDDGANRDGQKSGDTASKSDSKTDPKTDKPADSSTSADPDVLPTRTFTLDYTKYQTGESNEDPLLEDGDRIYINLRAEPDPVYKLRTVRIIGEVVREADVPIKDGMTVKDVIAAVGGLKETADRNNIRLHRIENGNDYVLRADSILSDDPVGNMKVVGGDYIFVMKPDLRLRWGIGGEVLGGKVFPYQPGRKVTITSAIERAGGLTKKADTHRSVLRKGFLIDPTRTNDIVFDYDAIKKNKQTDFEVEAGDLVVILPRQNRPTVWQKLLPIFISLLPLGL